MANGLNRTITSQSKMLLTHAFSSFHIKPLHSSYIPISSCSSSSSPTRRRLVRTTTTRKSNLKTLTSRIVQLTRRKQLRQIFNEIEVAKKHFWKLNTIVMNAVMEASVRCGDVESAIRIFEEMKCPEACGVDTVTYAILLKGCGQANDLVSVVQIVLEMKSRSELYIDRTAYTATVDALLKCGSFKGALCIFGEVQKQVDLKPELRPKPHLYLSLMRAFALRGDYHLVKNLHKRILPDTAGTSCPRRSRPPSNGSSPERRPDKQD